MAFFQWDFKTYSFAGPDTIGNALTWKQKTYKLKRYWLVTFSKLSHVFANAGFVEVFSNPIYGSRAFQFIYFIESTFSKWFHGSICVAAVIFARNFFINNILQWSINPINTIIGICVNVNNTFLWWIYAILKPILTARFKQEDLELRLLLDFFASQYSSAILFLFH